MNLRDSINETGVACLGWTGAVRFFGEYCFTVANGDIPSESTMGANWCRQNGHTQGRVLLGARLVGRGLRGLLPASPRRTRASRSCEEVSLGPNPRNFQEKRRGDA